MKKNLLFVAALAILASPSHLFAQQKKRCGTVEYMARLKAEDPTLAGRLREAEQMVQQDQQKQLLKTSSVTTIITIPVVFHVLYNNTAQNISQNRIVDQLAVLNKDYARMNADSNNTPVAFRARSANTQIQFCFAQRDPSGNPTSGVVRTTVTTSGFDLISNDDAKFTSLGGDDAWPRAQYLNVWIVNFSGQSASNGLLGITQMPGGAASTDGVVVYYTTVGGPNYHGTEPNYFLGRTLTHEVGHWLGMYHVWGDDDNGNGICEPATECSGTDYVSDTPNQGEENYGCPSFPKIDCCSSTPTGDPANGVVFMNYMDYTNDNCMNMFTQGQATRMHSVITTARSTIPNSNGCLAPFSVNEIHSAILEFSVFPNPAAGNVTVSGEFSNMTDVIITISNLLGEAVFSKTLKNVSYIKLPVDLSDRAEGIYNLALQTSGAVHNKKIIIAR